MKMEQWWNDIDWGKVKCSVKKKKTVPMPLCPSQISNKLAWE
jgi:hypothetical protein